MNSDFKDRKASYFLLWSMKKLKTPIASSLRRSHHFFIEFAVSPLRAEELWGVLDRSTPFHRMMIFWRGLHLFTIGAMPTINFPG